MQPITDRHGHFEDCHIPEAPYDEVALVLAQHSPVPSWIQSGGRIVFVNQAAIGMLGLRTAGEILGRSPATFQTERPILDEHKFYLKGRPAVLVTFTPNPTPPPVVSPPVPSNTLKTTRVLQAIGDAADFGAWICDSSGQSLYLSDSFVRLTGMTVDECKGLGWMKALRLENRQPVLPTWLDFVRTGMKWECEERILDAAGRWRPILSCGIPIRNDGGQIIFWAGVNIDVSQYKQAQQTLQDANEALSRSN